MAKECMLVRHSLLTALQALGDAERGRLFTAMLVYSMGGEEADGCSGNERIIWPIAKEMIDTDTASYRKKVSTRWNAKTEDISRHHMISEDNTTAQKISEDISRPPNPNPNPDPNPKPSIIPPNGGRARAKRFIPPTLAEVQAYVAERHSPVEPQEFIDFYAAKGWMVGKTPMKDWKAACRNAEKWDRWNRARTGYAQRTSWADLAAEMEGTL